MVRRMAPAVVSTVLQRGRGRRAEKERVRDPAKDPSSIIGRMQMILLESNVAAAKRADPLPCWDGGCYFRMEK